MRGRFLFVVSVALGLSVSSVSAANYKIDWYVIGAGGGAASSASYTVNATIGQPVAGFVSGASILHWIGFWAGEAPTPTVATSIHDVKLLPDGTFVSTAGKIATTAASEFSNFFYIEEADRSSGLRVAIPAQAVVGLVRGSKVDVLGTLATTADGERQIAGTVVVIGATQTPLEPLGMPNNRLGGGDLGSPPLGQMGVTGGFGLNNIGLLVKSWGEVTSAGAGFVTIDDGTGPIRVDTSVLVSQPVVGSYISVVGLSSLRQNGPDHDRLLLPRAGGDVTEP